MDLFTIIKSLTDKKFITIAELERRADLGNGTIRRWRNSIPSVDKVIKVANVLNVSIGYLLGDSLSQENNSFEKVLDNHIYSILKKKYKEHSEKELNIMQGIFSSEIMDFIDFVINKKVKKN